MKNQFMMQWLANKGQHHHHHHHQEPLYASDYEYQLVKDGRPYGTIVLTGDDFGAFKSEEEQNPKINTAAATTHHHHRPHMQNHAYTSGGESINGYHDEFPRSRQFFTNNPTANSSSSTYANAAAVDENINDEAEEFIQMEHQKFNFLINHNKRTWSSG